MKSMTGEVGKLSLNGEQIGGFKYWTAVMSVAFVGIEDKSHLISDGFKVLDRIYTLLADVKLAKVVEIYVSLWVPMPPALSENSIVGSMYANPFCTYCASGVG